VCVRANGSELVPDEPLPAAGELRFAAPAEPGWLRALLLLPPTAEPRAAACSAQQAEGVEREGFNCRDGELVAALTSAIYLRGKRYRERNRF
jgi:hypothetical protein